MEKLKKMENGFFYKIGVNALKLVVEDKVSNKECVNQQLVEEHHAWDNLF